MGAPAIVAGDQITGICSNHLIIGPLGAPLPTPSLPFAAPLMTGLSTNVLIGGKAAAVMLVALGASWCGLVLAPMLQLGGAKQTGNGHREGGWAVYDFFTEWKAVYIDYSGKLQRAQIDNY